jgi:hypothetical protein
LSNEYSFRAAALLTAGMTTRWPTGIYRSATASLLAPTARY